MSDIDISSAIQKHNSLSMAKAVAFGLLSAFFWLLSYYIFRWMILIPLSSFDMLSYEKYVPVVALVCCALLIIEGIRFGKPRLDLSDISAWRGTHTMGGRGVARGLVYAYFLTQLLFCAPRTMIYAITSWKSRIKTDEQLIRKLNSTITKIAAGGNWIDSLEVEDEAAVPLLKMKFCRFRNSGTAIEIGLTRKAKDTLGIKTPDLLNQMGV